jgi:hypothetical protein
MASILGMSGAQNVGGRGERNMCYHFAVTPGQQYKLQMMFLKNGEGSSTGIWIRPNGVVLTRGDEAGYIGWNTTEQAAVEALDVEPQIRVLGGDPGVSALLWTYEFTGDADGSLNIELAKWWDGDVNRVGQGGIMYGDPTSSVTDVNAITLELVSIPGDFDLDGDVDLSDFGHYQLCFNPALQISGPTDLCADADLDGSGFVDSSDLSLFEQCLSGPGIPANFGCAEQ